MRKHLSVFMLYVRISLYPTAVVLLLMAAAELVGFRLLGCGQEERFGSGTCAILLQTAFFAGYLFTVSFCLGSVRKNCKTGYTLQRLRISEFWTFVWHSVSNICMFLLLYMTQILVLFLLARSYAAQGTYAEGAQGIFIDCFRAEFPHAVLPLDEVSLWIRNGIYVLAAGISVAYAVLRARYGKFSIAALFVIALTVRAFPAPIGSGTEGGLIAAIVLFFTAVICVIGAVLTANCGEGREYDDL